MTTIETNLIKPMAYYVAGRAVADLLLGAKPICLYRWDKVPVPAEVGIEERSMAAAKLGMKFAQIVLCEKPKKSEIKLARSLGLNNAFAILSGIGAIDLIDRFRKDFLHHFLALTAHDIDRAARVVRPLVESAEMATFLAVQALEETISFFQNPQIRSCVEGIAGALIYDGALADDTDIFEFICPRLEEHRVIFPDTAFAWPLTSGVYIDRGRAAQSENHPAGDTHAPG